MKRNALRRRVLALALTLVFVLSQTVFAFADTGILNRADVPESEKWKMTDIFRTTADFDAACTKIEKKLIPAVSKLKGKLDNPDSVLEYFKAQEALWRLMDQVYVYAYMQADIDSTDTAATELCGKADSVNTKAAEADSYFSAELLDLSKANFNAIYNSPKLKPYKYILTKIKNQKDHTLSKKEEKLLAAAGAITSAPSDLFKKVTSADMKFGTFEDNGKTVVANNSAWSTYLDNPNRELRKKVFEAHYGSYDKVKNTLASNYIAQIKADVFYAKARNYDSALESALAADQIPAKVYNNLVAAVNKNVDPLHKYVGLRKAYMNTDKVHVYDMYFPMVSDVTMDMSYADAQKAILEGLKPLGTAYTDQVAKAFTSNWIDVRVTPNKYSGAYNWGSYDTHPYILMNYNDTAGEMLTLSHELGHAMHSFYSNANQKYANSNTPIFTAEVASTTNELIMTKYLLANAKTNKEKLYLTNQLIENIRGSVYTQIMYAEFEKTAHEKIEKGEPLSADGLRAIWKDLMVKYYGNDFEVDEMVTLWWSRISHFYNSFYVYKYATGMAAAYPLAEGLVNGTPEAQKKYLNFLKAGNSDYPIEILKDAGVDMSSTKPVDDLLTYFGELVDQMEQLMKAEGTIK